jgi:hypothetical protein
VLALFTMGLPSGETVPVSTEDRGKAREFIRRAYAEDEVRVAMLRGFGRDMQQHQDRRPGKRRLRRDMLQDIVRRWEAGPREFRLRFEVEWKGRNLSAIEVLISGGTVYSSDWTTDAAELNLMINVTALKADRQGIDFAKTGTVCLSFHAIGRYFQRQPERSYADLLRDLAVFSRIAVSPDALEQEVRYATEGGTWVGQIIVCEIGRPGETEQRAVAFIRTWITR